MRFRNLVLVGTLVLPCPALAQNTLAAMIFTQYRVAPVIPFAAFHPESPNAPLPGSAIADISQRMLDGISATDLSTATICRPSRTATGQFQGTQGFRRLFPAGNPENKAELRLLFGFDNDRPAGGHQGAKQSLGEMLTGGFLGDQDRDQADRRQCRGRL
jgi:hypothetical protein